MAVMNAGNRKPQQRPAPRSKAKKARVRAPAGATSRDPRQDFNEDEWRDMVATAAYYRAEARGFANGSAEDDWHEAEAQLREQLARAEDEADNRDAATLDLTAHSSVGQDED